MDKYNWEGKTILVAEDVQINFKLLELNLKKTGVNILWAKNGEEAIEKYKTGKVDLILMDIQMPEMTGIEATQEIRKTDSKIPIIAQTAFTMSDEKDMSMEAGCNDYISKPINKRELLLMIDKFLSKAQS